MGKIYSQSLGKFIDTPDTASGGGVPEGYGTQSDPLKTIFTKLFQTAPGTALKYGTQFKAAQDIMNPQLSAAEQKSQSAFKGSLGLIDILEQNFTNAKGGEYTGPGAIVAGTKKNIFGKLNIDKLAGIYNREKSGFTANLKTITGDVGVMTQKDYERIESLLPKFTDDPEMAAQFFKDMRQIIANKFEGTQSQSKYVRPEVKGGLLSSIAPNLAKLLGTVGNYPQILQKGGQEMQQKGAFAPPSEELKQLVGGSPLQRTMMSQGAAGEVATPFIIGAEMKRGLVKLLDLFKPKVSEPKFSPDILQKGLGLVEKGKTSRTSVINLAEETGKTVDGTTLSGEIQKWGKKAVAAGEDAKMVKQKVKQAVNSFKDRILSPTEAKDLWDTATQGFKDSGKLGNTVLSGYQRALRDALRIQLEKVAPGFEKGTATISKGLEMEKLLSQVRDSLQKSILKGGLVSPKPVERGATKFVRSAGATAAGGALALALYKLLGLGNQGQR